MEIKAKKILKCTTLVVMFNTYEMHQEEMNILNHLKKRDKEFESLAEVVYCYSEGMELKKERILFYKGVPSGKRGFPTLRKLKN